MLTILEDKTPQLVGEIYRYTRIGNLTRQTDAKGQRLCFAYGALDRLTGKHYNGTSNTCPATPTTITYSYDRAPSARAIAPA